MLIEPKYRRNSSSYWTALNPLLDSGEPVFETDTGNFKIGDGRKRWNELEYFLRSDQTIELINQSVEEAVAALVLSQGGITAEQFLAHVNSLTPHPVYDDGPSLLLLYQNVKV